MSQEISKNDEAGMYADFSRKIEKQIMGKNHTSSYVYIFCVAVIIEKIGKYYKGHVKSVVIDPDDERKFPGTNIQDFSISEEYEIKIEMYNGKDFETAGGDDFYCEMIEETYSNFEENWADSYSDKKDILEFLSEFDPDETAAGIIGYFEDDEQVNYDIYPESLRDIFRKWVENYNKN